MKNLITRTITGVIFVAAIVVCFLNVRAMAFLFALVTGLTIWEYAGLVNENVKDVKVNQLISTVSGVFLFLAVTCFCSGITNSSIFIPYLLSVIYLMISELYLKNPNPLNCWAYTMLSQMYIALPLSMVSVLAFRTIPGTGEVVYMYIIPLSVFILLWCNDTGAYCSGSLFGKHKLFPRISPGKSWEGSIGGAVFAMIAAGVIGYLTKGTVNDAGLSIPEWIGLAVVVVVFGTWGDLVESLMKRTLGVKDSGNILPGHGGMLDRFDSSLMAIPATVLYLYTLTMI